MPYDDGTMNAAPLQFYYLQFMKSSFSALAGRDLRVVCDRGSRPLTVRIPGGDGAGVPAGQRAATPLARVRGSALPSSTVPRRTIAWA